MQRLGSDPSRAAAVLDETDRNRARYHREHYRRDWNDPAYFHMVLNTGALGFGGAAEVIVARAGALGWTGAVSGKRDAVSGEQ
jgi:cytidylate kinase